MKIKKKQWWHKKLEKSKITAIINEIIKNEDLTTGNYTKNYERNICKYLNAKFCVAVSNGSMANLLAFLALGVKTNDEVVIPNIGWISVINACKIIGAKPVIVDVEKNRPIIDASKIKAVISKKTKVIFPVYMNGRSANIEQILKICKKNKIFLVEDAAQAMGIRYKKKFLGTYGDVGIFSTSATKMMTTGLGGFLVTNNKNLAEKIFNMRRHGFTNIQNIRAWDKFGGNFQISSIQSVMGIEQLKTLNQKLQINKNNYKYLIKKLKDYVNFIKPIEINLNQGEVPVYNEFRVKYRTELVKYLNNYKIENRLVSPNFERVKYIEHRKNKLGYPNSRDYEKNNLYLTSGPGLDTKDLDKMIKIIKKFYKKYE